jgi:hypothetical protein
MRTNMKTQFVKHAVATAILSTLFSQATFAVDGNEQQLLQLASEGKTAELTSRSRRPMAPLPCTGPFITTMLS